VVDHHNCLELNDRRLLLLQNDYSLLEEVHGHPVLNTIGLLLQQQQIDYLQQVEVRGHRVLYKNGRLLPPQQIGYSQWVEDHDQQVYYTIDLLPLLPQNENLKLEAGLRYCQQYDLDDSYCHVHFFFRALLRLTFQISHLAPVAALAFHDDRCLTGVKW
jgi:hypothetical protein